MEISEIDEFEGDSLRLLGYLAHGLFGYLIGVSLYCVYLLVALVFSVEVHQPFGYMAELHQTVVWGRDISDVAVWGFLFPIGVTLSGLLQARFIPLSYLCDREMLVFLISGVLFMSFVMYLLLNSMTTSYSQVFVHPISPSLSP